MKVVKSKAEFLALVPDKTAALRRADRCRDLELDMYWRRAAYFWAFSAAAFAGYLALSSAQTPSHGLLLVTSCVGTVFSFVWYLANRGGKYWHTNWECQIHLLEDAVSGPIYKTNLVRHGWKNALHPVGAYPFSVSKLNHLLSLFVTLVWAVLATDATLKANLGLRGSFSMPGAVLVLTIAFLFLLPVFGRSSRRTQSLEVAIEVGEYEEDHETG